MKNFSHSPRIISGSAKNQKLFVPEKGTRPMTDRVKSSLFSIINEEIQNSNVLDLYAGTGAIGIECLSRGAKYAVFVDKSKEAIRVIDKNLEKTGFPALASVVKASVKRFLEEFDQFKFRTEKFDIIFITTPHRKFKADIIERVGQYLSENGIVILEFPKGRKTLEKTEQLIRFDERIYGINCLAFYKRL